MIPTLLHLVRHGETAANQDKIWHGSIDTPLSERGVAQARRVAEFLRARLEDPVAIYSSPLQRARHTADAIASALELGVQIEDDLREFDLGRWEGKSYAELHTKHQLWHHMKRDPDFAPHGGESPRQVAERYAAALHRIGDRHPGRRIVVVGHGGALSMGMALLLEGDYTQWGRVMSNCGVSELALGPEVALHDFNHTGHLDAL